MKKTFKFLLMLAVWLFAMYAALASFYYDSLRELVDAIRAKGSYLKELIFTVKGFFVHADSWNYVSLVIFLSGFLWLFVINDYAINRFFKTKSKSFLKEGSLFLTQKAVSCVLVFVQFLILANGLIIAHGYLRSIGLDDIKSPMPVLVLGTNKNLTHTVGKNVYFDQRIATAYELYREGKVSKFYLSGDNGSDGYNEPEDMKHDLMVLGVPEKMIELDYAGFRTFDSVVRLKYHFKIRDAIIVSQRFQVERALAIAKYFEINPQGYPSAGSMTFAMMKRELFAKPKVLMDIFLFNTQPHFGKLKERKQLSLDNSEHIILLACTVLLTLILSILALQRLKLN